MQRGTPGANFRTAGKPSKIVSRRAMHLGEGLPHCCPLALSLSLHNNCPHCPQQPQPSSGSEREASNQAAAGRQLASQPTTAGGLSCPPLLTSTRCGESTTSWLLPRPSCPNLPQPHAHSAPLLSAASMCRQPPATRLIFSRPGTWRGIHTSLQGRAAGRQAGEHKRSEGGCHHAYVRAPAIKHAEQLQAQD